MNFNDMLKAIKATSPLDIILFVVFVFYLVFPIETPYEVAGYIDSSIGMAVILLITIYLFLYRTPVLGILSIFVAYEVLRRSSAVVFGTKIGNADTNWISGSSVAMEHTPTQHVKDVQLQNMNPPKNLTLEEQVVSEMAPIAKKYVPEYEYSEYKPVQNEIHGGSLL